jgi:UDP-N-acetyl-D-glucosamine dehydrogenase
MATDPLDAATQADATVIVTDHSQFDYLPIVQRSPLIVDTRNALRGCTSPNIIRL